MCVHLSTLTVTSVPWTPSHLKWDAWATLSLAQQCIWWRPKMGPTPSRRCARKAFLRSLPTPVCTARVMLPRMFEFALRASGTKASPCRDIARANIFWHSRLFAIGILNLLKVASLQMTNLAVTVSLLRSDLVRTVSARCDNFGIRYRWCIDVCFRALFVFSHFRICVGLLPVQRAISKNSTWAPHEA